MPDLLLVHLIGADLKSNSLESQFRLNFQLINDKIEGKSEKIKVDHTHMSSHSNRDKEYLNWDEKMKISLDFMTARSILRLTLFKEDVVTKNQSVYAEGDVLISSLYSFKNFLNDIKSLSVSEVVSTIENNLQINDRCIELKINSSKDKSNLENQTASSPRDNIRDAEDIYHNFLDSSTSNVVMKPLQEKNLSTSALEIQQSNKLEGKYCNSYTFHK
jgi:hypothetical protein